MAADRAVKWSGVIWYCRIQTIIIAKGVEGDCEGHQFGNWHNVLITCGQYINKVIASFLEISRELSIFAHRYLSTDI